ncbi:UNVERIFIED_CONTAM: riboflavin kinase [Hammondia hammondi]|eukprot:XP_008886412.1 riboflavin kinase [Hammondia hammondi]
MSGPSPQPPEAASRPGALPTKRVSPPSVLLVEADALVLDWGSLLQCLLQGLLGRKLLSEETSQLLVPGSSLLQVGARIIAEAHAPRSSHPPQASNPRLFSATEAAKSPMVCEATTMNASVQTLCGRVLDSVSSTKVLTVAHLSSEERSPPAPGHSLPSEKASQPFLPRVLRSLQATVKPHIGAYRFLRVLLLHACGDTRWRSQEQLATLAGAVANRRASQDDGEEDSACPVHVVLCTSNAALWEEHLAMLRRRGDTLVAEAAAESHSDAPLDGGDPRAASGCLSPPQLRTRRGRSSTSELDDAGASSEAPEVLTRLVDAGSVSLFALQRGVDALRLFVEEQVQAAVCRNRGAREPRGVAKPRGSPGGAGFTVETRAKSSRTTRATRGSEEGRADPPLLGETCAVAVAAKSKAFARFASAAGFSHSVPLLRETRLQPSSSTRTSACSASEFSTAATTPLSASVETSDLSSPERRRPSGLSTPASPAALGSFELCEANQQASSRESTPADFRPCSRCGGHTPEDRDRAGFENTQGSWRSLAFCSACDEALETALIDSIDDVDLLRLFHPHARSPSVRAQAELPSSLVSTSCTDSPIAATPRSEKCPPHSSPCSSASSSSSSSCSPSCCRSSSSVARIPANDVRLLRSGFLQPPVYPEKVSPLGFARPVPASGVSASLRRSRSKDRRGTRPEVEAGGESCWQVRCAACRFLAAEEAALLEAQDERENARDDSREVRADCREEAKSEAPMTPTAGISQDAFGSWEDAVSGLEAWGKSVELMFPVLVTGTVVKGFGRGSKMLGIPTANVREAVVPVALACAEAEALWSRTARKVATRSLQGSVKKETETRLRLQEAGQTAALGDGEREEGDTGSERENEDWVREVIRTAHPVTLFPGVYYGWATLHPLSLADAGGETERDEIDRKNAKVKVFKTAMSVGYNPYFGNTSVTIEPYIYHAFDEDFVGSPITVLITGFLRSEAAFSSFGHLIQAIQNDCEICRRALDHPSFLSSKRLLEGLCQHAQ